MEITPLERALVAVDGNQSELARICGVTQPTVWGWLNSKRKRLPAEYVHAVSEVTGIKPHELRPDVFRAPDPADQSDQRQILCDPCGKRVDGIVAVDCVAVDCPHSQRDAA